MSKRLKISNDYRQESSPSLPIPQEVPSGSASRLRADKGEDGDNRQIEYDYCDEQSPTFHNPLPKLLKKSRLILKSKYLMCDRDISAEVNI